MRPEVLRLEGHSCSALVAWDGSSPRGMQSPFRTSKISVCVYRVYANDEINENV